MITALFCDSVEDWTSLDAVFSAKYVAEFDAHLADTGVFRTGSRSMRLVNTSYVIRALGAAYQRVSVAAAVYINNAPGGTQAFIRLNRTISPTAEVQFTLSMNSSRQLLLYRGNNSTLLATGTTVLSLSTWYHIEIRLHCDNSGSYDLLINSVVELTGSAVDTQQQTDGDITHVVLIGPTTFTWVDDIVMATHSSDSDRIGDAVVRRLSPSGAGATTDFTPSTGSNFQNVDDAQHDGDSTYNSSSVAGDTDTYAFGNTSGTGTVLGVQVVCVFRKDDGGSATIATVARSGGVDYPAAAVGVSNSYLGQLDMLVDNPDTSSPWSLSEIDSAEFGVTRVS